MPAPAPTSRPPCLWLIPSSLAIGTLISGLASAPADARNPWPIQWKGHPDGP
jgi:hypothetical protein